MSTQRKLGELAPFSCPECGGALWEVAEGSLLRYRCHVGHAYTAESMLAAQTDATDALLNRLLRSYRERAELARRLARKERARQQSGSARSRAAPGIQFVDQHGLCARRGHRHGQMGLPVHAA